MTRSRAGNEMTELVHQGRNQLPGVTIEQTSVELDRPAGKVGASDGGAQPRVVDDAQSANSPLRAETSSKIESQSRQRLGSAP